MAPSLLLASAGAGKSKLIAESALGRARGGGRVLLLTFTINNQMELVKHICRLNKYQPKNVIVKGWFTFLLEDMIRPYQRAVLSERVSGVYLNASNPHLITSRGKRFNLKGTEEMSSGRFNPRHFVTKNDHSAHSCFLAKLAARVSEQTGGKPAKRLREIYDSIYVDEVQDLVGWDFAVLRAIAGASFSRFDCVGDFRQTVYQTSEATKRPQTSFEKVAEFKAMGFDVHELAISWRSVQSICDIADRLHAKDGHYAATKSKVELVPPEFAEHQGVFAVPRSLVEAYLAMYNPVILRWSRSVEKELCAGRPAYNFGEAKGLGFDRVLILPPDKHAKFLCGDTTAFDGASTDDSKNKLYVGLTRARYSVAFAHKGGSVVNGASVWSEP